MKNPIRNKQAGLTLIELMIVITIIVVIAVITIPALLRAKISANEASAMGTLHSLAIGEVEFQEQAFVDQDTNGKGEFGVFGEISGNVDIRIRGTRVNPGGIIGSLVPVAGASTVSKSGYLFQIFLPGSGAPITDDGTNTPIIIDPATDPEAITAQESRMLCYAWPQGFNTTGIQVFAIAGDFAIHSMTNNDSQYSGADNPVSFNALFVTGEGDDLLRGKIALKAPSNAVGGESWVVK